MTIEEMFVDMFQKEREKCKELEVEIRREKKCNEMFESFCDILAKYAVFDENGLHITISKHGKEKADCGYVAEFLELNNGNDNRQN